MITREELHLRRDEIYAIAKKYGASDIRIFGSVARGDATESSDVDFVVRFEKGRSLMDHGGLLMDLRDYLNVKVDVISESGMRARFRETVMKDVVPL